MSISLASSLHSSYPANSILRSGWSGRNDCLVIHCLKPLCVTCGKTLSRPCSMPRCRLHPVKWKLSGKRSPVRLSRNTSFQSLSQTGVSPPHGSRVRSMREASRACTTLRSAVVTSQRMALSLPFSCLHLPHTSTCSFLVDMVPGVPWFLVISFSSMSVHFSMACLFFLFEIR